MAAPPKKPAGKGARAAAGNPGPTAPERKKLVAKGKALPEKGATNSGGRFPIRNAADLDRAIKAVGRAKDPDAVKKFIMKRAKELGLESKIPSSWKKSTDK